MRASSTASCAGCGRRRRMPPGMALRRGRRLRARRAVPVFRRRRLILLPQPREQRAGVAAAPSSASSACCGTPASRSAHSVRTIDECESEMAGDVTVRTSLLEHRLLAGSRALYRPLSRDASRRRSTCARSTRPRCSSSSSATALPGRGLQPRAEHQGKPRRPARPADDPVDRARRRHRPHLARARATAAS